MKRRSLLNKVMIIHHAKKAGNISKICRKYDISRVSYYHIEKTVKAALDKFAVKGTQEEQLSILSEFGDKVEMIKELALDNPRLSTYAISTLLYKRHNIKISHMGVYNILKSINLSTSYNRCQYLEERIKLSFDEEYKKLNPHQLISLKEKNPCFASYLSKAKYPFEQLNLDVIRFKGIKLCIAIDPLTNYAFACIFASVKREKLIAWLDERVLAKSKKLGLPTKILCTSKLKIFDENLEGDSDYIEFYELVRKYDTQIVLQTAMRPELDGIIKHFVNEVKHFFEQCDLTKPMDICNKELQLWLEDYNYSYSYPNYPNYSATHARMVYYYLKHKKMWRGVQSVLGQSNLCILPIVSISRSNNRKDQGIFSIASFCGFKLRSLSY